jgi:hypothetical protein
MGARAVRARPSTGFCTGLFHGPQMALDQLDDLLGLGIVRLFLFTQGIWISVFVVCGLRRKIQVQV